MVCVQGCEDIGHTHRIQKLENERLEILNNSRNNNERKGQGHQQKTPAEVDPSDDESSVEDSMSNSSNMSDSSEDPPVSTTATLSLPLH